VAVPPLCEYQVVVEVVVPDGSEPPVTAVGDVFPQPARTRTQAATAPPECTRTPPAKILLTDPPDDSRPFSHPTGAERAS
jgi:hypothetical protein